MLKTAVVTGAGGQDGSYLVEFLLDMDYDVFALYRPSATHDNQMPNIFGNRDKESRFFPIYGDLLDESTIRKIVNGCDEFYHLAALSHVGESFKHPELTMQVNFQVTCKLLERIREESPKTRFYFAGTSETLADACMYVGSHGIGADDCFINPHRCHCLIGSADHTDRFTAHSPYAVSKVASQNLVRVYREAFNLYAVNGIAFNHESPRRGPNFVTAKIVDTLNRIKRDGGKLTLGKDTYRDWHDARDTVRGMWLSLQQNEARDYTFASGKTYSVKEFADTACRLIGLQSEEIVEFKEGVVETRPWDVDYLRGDPTIAEDVLGWKREYDLVAIINSMLYERDIRYA